MCIFVDGGSVADIAAFHAAGIIRGVTSNPSILQKFGLFQETEITRWARDVAAAIDPLPLSLQVSAQNPQGMLHEALLFGSWATNIVVKIPIDDGRGSLEYLQVIHELRAIHHLQVNVTAVMSPQQCMMAAAAGANYISLFAGRINDMGHRAQEDIRAARSLVDLVDPRVRLIACSVREVSNAVDWLLAGAHVVTLSPTVLMGLVKHPYTGPTVRDLLKELGSGGTHSGEGANN